MNYLLNMVWKSTERLEIWVWKVWNFEMKNVWNPENNIP